MALRSQPLARLIGAKFIVHGKMTNSNSSQLGTIFQESLDFRLEVDNHLTGRDSMYTTRVNRLNWMAPPPSRQLQ